MIDVDEARAREIAAEIARLKDAADAARALLDFNDEPARFLALLSTPPAPQARRRK